MIRRTFILTEAQTNVIETALWYEQREPGLGDRFVREIRQSLRAIAKMPLRFPIVENGVRPCCLTDSHILFTFFGRMTLWLFWRSFTNTESRRRGKSHDKLAMKVTAVRANDDYTLDLRFGVESQRI
jgi:hypothetical protein